MPSDAKTPDRHSRKPGQKKLGKNDLSPGYPKDSLEVGDIIDSFLEFGIFCGVIKDGTGHNEAIKKADIVVLDWFLKERDSKITLNILRDLVKDLIVQDSLRLVAIYTGNQDFDKILDEIEGVLSEFPLCPERNTTKPEIKFKNGRVTLYAKPEVKLGTYKNRSVCEKDLPRRLVKDFASMTEGLLPGIVLTSLAAVRENSIRVLNRFNSALDPAFLTQRVLISNPDEAEQQMVSHIAEELLCLMVDAVFEVKPAGFGEIKKWLENQGNDNFQFNGKSLSLEKTIELTKLGLNRFTEAEISKRKAHKFLTNGFSQDKNSNFLDEKLAWTINSKGKYNYQPPQLDQGTIVSNDSKVLLCIRPSCDCVRLDNETVFYFLPLIENGIEKEHHKIVVKIEDNFKVFRIDFDQSNWVHYSFTPDPEVQYIKAKPKENSYYFKNSSGEEILWIGQLKPEYTQRVSQKLASTLSRIGVDESEWLRRP